MCSLFYTGFGEPGMCSGMHSPGASVRGLKIMLTGPVEISGQDVQQHPSGSFQLPSPLKGRKSRAIAFSSGPRVVSLPFPFTRHFRVPACRNDIRGDRVILYHYLSLTSTAH